MYIAIDRPPKSADPLLGYLVDSRGGRGGGHDSNSAWYLFRITMIHRFMTSHPVSREAPRWTPDAIWFLRLTELCILNAENVQKEYSRPFKQMS